MQKQIGTLLWEMRTARGLSMSELARRAAISKATLSYWEAGKRIPRTMELEAVLVALGATAAQKTQAFAAIHAPRAVRHLRDEAKAEWGTPPALGDLLRAMRLRKGWTQEQTAVALEVGQGTVARWERGERTPANEQMQMLCYLLGAREAEIETLTAGRFADVLPETASQAWEEQVYHIHVRLTQFRTQDFQSCWELLFLGLERKAWLLATQNSSAGLALTSVLAHHAEQHCRHEHWAEAHRLSQRALLLRQKQSLDEDTRLRAALAHAASAVYQGHRLFPERGLRVLQQHFSAASRPEFRAWMLSDMAEYAALAGQTDSALKWAAQAVAVACECDNEAEVYLRRSDYAQRLLQAGFSGAALEQLREPMEYNAVQYTGDLLLFAEAHLIENHLSEAHDWLNKARAVVEAGDLPSLRAKTDALANRF